MIVQTQTTFVAERKTMIKRLDPIDSTKTGRRGFQHISQVIERLIKFYELQAEMNAKREFEVSVQPELVVTSTVSTQSTFGWE